MIDVLTYVYTALIATSQTAALTQLPLITLKSALFLPVHNVGHASQQVTVRTRVICYYMKRRLHTNVYHKGAIAPYIGIVRVGQHRSHTLGKSAFPWRYALNSESVFTKGYLWLKYGGPKNDQNQITRKSLKVSILHFLVVVVVVVVLFFNSCISKTGLS